MDKLMQDQKIPGGTTATVVLITQDKIVCANAGDSRSVVSVGGGPKNGGDALDLSKDHKPEDELEKTRIEKAGGTVEWKKEDKTWRVNGRLAVSRALGDFDFKQNGDLDRFEQAVSCEPDVSERPRQDVDFILLACDGVWEWEANEEPTLDKSTKGAVADIH